MLQVCMAHMKTHPAMEPICICDMTAYETRCIKRGQTKKTLCQEDLSSDMATASVRAGERGEGKKLIECLTMRHHWEPCFGHRPMFHGNVQ